MSLTWLGDEERRRIIQGLAASVQEMHLQAEANAKRQLYPGHGLLTGTLRRSIHAARPNYSWGGDDVPPTANAPERGGRGGGPRLMSGKIVGAVGTGMRYSRRIEQLYGFMSQGYRQAAAKLDGILARHLGGR